MFFSTAKEQYKSAMKVVELTIQKQDEPQKANMPDKRVCTYSEHACTYYMRAFEDVSLHTRINAVDNLLVKQQTFSHFWLYFCNQKAV